MILNLEGGRDPQNLFGLFFRILPTLSLNWTNEFKSETAQRIIIREHSRDSQNLFGLFKLRVGIICFP